MSCPVIELARQPVCRPSLGPDDTGYQALMIEHLRTIGSTVKPMDFGDAQNFWAWRGHGETLALAGHTDVVPAGNTDRWINPPFESTVHNGILLGRDAADMKGSLAAMVVVAERFVAQYSNHRDRLTFLITSDKEASVRDDAVKVVETLTACNKRPDYCLIGEPSSTEVVGDVVKNNRHSSLACNLAIHGVRGHVAYLHLADNPSHRATPMLAELVNTEWGKGNEFFPPTGMQVANVQFDTSSNNMIPGDMFARFNFRLSTELADEMIKACVVSLLEKRQLHYSVEWQFSDQPFLTERGKLVDMMVSAIEHHNEIKPQLSADGSTSDGRSIARMGTQVVELGPMNVTTHRIDEYVNAVDLQLLARMYQRIIEQLVA